MCRPETTAYGCGHQHNHSFHICAARTWLLSHLRYANGSSGAQKKQRYEYMRSRCKRDKARGATILFLRMDERCETCEREGRVVKRWEGLEIRVGDVRVRVLRGEVEGAKREGEVKGKEEVGKVEGGVERSGRAGGEGGGSN